MATFTLEAPAKINLFLDVKPQLTESGYHLIDTLMLPVSLYDSLTVDVAPLAGVPVTPPLEKAPIDIRFSPRLTCDEAASSVYKVILAMHDAFRDGVFDSSFRVAVDKRIPEKSGLGGGSSDAAAVILTLCTLWDLDPVSDEVIAVAAKVGADVPFFLFSYESDEAGGTHAKASSEAPAAASTVAAASTAASAPTAAPSCAPASLAKAAYLSGIGEELASRMEALSLNLVLVKPPQVSISTEEAYARYDLEHPAGKSTQEFLSAYEAALKAPNIFSAHPVVPQDLMTPLAQELFIAMGNNLEPVALRLAPALEEVRRYLIESPRVFASMLAGSGAAMFGICPALKDAEDIAYDAAQKGWWATAVSTRCPGLSVLET